MRFVGTSSCRASSAALMPSSSISSFKCSPGCIGVCAIVFLHSVVINDLNIHRPGRAGRPFKAYPPFVIDADAVLASAIAFQGFKTVAGQGRKVSERRSRFETIKLQAAGPFNAGKGFDPSAGSKFGGPLVPIADDHL